MQVNTIIAATAFATSLASLWFSHKQLSLMQEEHKAFVANLARRPELSFMVQERGGGPALSQSLEAAVTPSAGGIDLALYIVNSGNKGALNARVNLVWPALEGLGDPVLDSSERIELEGPFETAEELIAGIGSHWYRWHADYPSGTNVGTHFYIPISRDLDFPLQVRIDAEDLAETVVERVSISVRRAE